IPGSPASAGDEIRISSPGLFYSISRLVFELCREAFHTAESIQVARGARQQGAGEIIRAKEGSMRLQSKGIQAGVLLLGLLLALGVFQAQETGKNPSSYSPVVIQEDFTSIMSRMSAAKPGIMKRQKDLLEQRYDL